MDYTETPHAEDFAQELAELVAQYIDRGLPREMAIKILGWEIDDLISFDDDE